MNLRDYLTRIGLSESSIDMFINDSHSLEEGYINHYLLEPKQVRYHISIFRSSTGYTVTITEVDDSYNDITTVDQRSFNEL